MESPGKIQLPRAFEDADIDHLVVLIADMLDRLMLHNDRIPLSPEALTRFHSRSPPAISVLEYLRRIVRYANVERVCLLITLHYIDQLCARLPHFSLSSLTAHRFIITAIVVSSKALCDAFSTNSHYAKVGGIRVGELNVLEREFLSFIDWRLTCTREVLEAYYVNLIRTHSKNQYKLAQSTSPQSLSDDEMDSGQSSPRPTVTDDETGPSRDLSPSPEPKPRLSVEPSTVLLDRATLSPKASNGPTIEQNMAFAALQDPLSRSPSASATTRVKKEVVEVDLNALPHFTPVSTKTSPSSSSTLQGFNGIELSPSRREKRAVDDDSDSSAVGGTHSSSSTTTRPRVRPRRNTNLEGTSNG